MSSFGRQAPGAGARLGAGFFDVLHVDGTDLLDRPLAERLEELDRVTGAAAIPRLVTADAGEAEAFAADALARANEKLAAEGLALLVLDAYRPWSVTKLFWDLTPLDRRDFVANPRDGSRHNRGCAVDVTLVELATGRELAMPSDWDEFTERAHPAYAGGTDEERANRDHLRRTMESEGFTVYENEWWHFDYRDWPEYPVMDEPVVGGPTH